MNFSQRIVVFCPDLSGSLPLFHLTQIFPTSEVVKNEFVGCFVLLGGGGSVCEKYLKANVFAAAMIGKG